MKDDEELMNDVVRYLDSLVTTINPGLGASFPEWHPCQKRSDELLHYELQDYVDLVNKLQRHTRCNSSYCLRVDRIGCQYCRFGYPKEITENTHLRDDNGQPELITARNDLLLNPHDHLQLQGWRTNVDLKSVFSIEVALHYISKYVSKSEPHSAAFFQDYQ